MHLFLKDVDVVYMQYVRRLLGSDSVAHLVIQFMSDSTQGEKHCIRKIHSAKTQRVDEENGKENTKKYQRKKYSKLFEKLISPKNRKRN